MLAVGICPRSHVRFIPPAESILIFTAAAARQRGRSKAAVEDLGLWFLVAAALKLPVLALLTPRFPLVTLHVALPACDAAGKETFSQRRFGK